VRAIGVDGARQKLNEMESEGVTLIEESALDIGGAPVLKALLKYAIHRQK